MYIYWYESVKNILFLILGGQYLRKYRSHFWFYWKDNTRFVFIIVETQ